MRSILLLLRHHLRSCRSDLRLWASLLIGIAICIAPIHNYLSFAEVSVSTHHVLEPFILIGSTVMQFTGIAIGWLIAVLGAPFITERTTYEILRVGRKCYLAERIWFIILLSMMYLIGITAATCLLGLIRGNTIWVNEWSPAMRTLAERQPAFAITTFKLHFPYPQYINMLSPYAAAALTLLLNWGYLTILGLVALLINSFVKPVVGVIAAFAVHIAGYLIYTNAYLGLPQQASLLVCAMPAYYFGNSDMKLYLTLTAYAAIILGISLTIRGLHRRFNP